MHADATSFCILCTVSEAAHAAVPSTMLGEAAYSTYLDALTEACRPRPCMVVQCQARSELLHEHGSWLLRAHKHHLRLVHPNLADYNMLLHPNSCNNCFLDWQDIAEASRKGKEDRPGISAGSPTTLHHLPLHACALDTDSFVLPAGSSTAAQAMLGGLPAGLHAADDDLAGMPPLIKPPLLAHGTGHFGSKRV